METNAPAVLLPRDQNQAVLTGSKAFRHFAEESRVPVQVVTLLRFVTMAVLAAGPLFRPGRTVGAALACLLAAAAVYVFNGVMDRVEDRANGSARPISSGRLPVSTAVQGILAAGCAALLLAWFSGGPALISVLGAYLAFGYAYSGAPFHGKRSGRGASLLVLGLGICTYAAGWLSSGHRHPIAALLLTAAMSLWMAAVGALVKDLSDVRGDIVAGRRTPHIVWGSTRTRLVASLNGFAIGGGYLAAATAWAPVLVPSALVLLAGAFVVAVFARTTRHSVTRDDLRLPYRAFMVTQYGANAALLFWLLVR